MPRLRSAVAPLAIVACAVLLSAAVAVAATTTALGTWTFGGAPAAYSGTMHLPGIGFPATTWTSNSKSGSAVGVQNGTGMWFNPSSPPGQVFGSSRGKPYLSLYAANDSGPVGTPSQTTYTFAAPTPGGWGFVLGDIDADRVSVSAVRADGSAASTADLGFVGVFSMCVSSPKPPGCGTFTDVPSWDAATATLTGIGTDTAGAAGWFRPSASLRSLTFTYSKQLGGPSFQTWFAERMHALTGRIEPAAGCDPTTARIDLLGVDGTVIATRTPDDDGAWEFDGVAATSGLTVRLTTPPEACRTVGPTSVPVDLSASDDTASFSVTTLTTVRGHIEGVVVDAAGAPVANVLVTVDAVGGVEVSDRTDAQGRFELPDLPPGTYTVRVDPPGAYLVVGGATRTATIADDGSVTGLQIQLRLPRSTRPAATSRATPAAQVLPNVGAPVSPWLPLGGAALVLAGAFVVRRARKA